LSIIKITPIVEMETIYFSTMYLKQENNTYRREEEPMKKDGAVGMQINCVSNLIRRSIDLRIAGMPGEKLSRMDSWIIHYMLDHQQEDVFQKDVEKALAMTRSNVSKAVDQMVSKGLIMRSPVDYDARLKKLTLTPKVLEIHRQIEGEIAEFEKLLVEGFTTRELEQFKDYLERIAHNINDNTKRQQDERKRRDF
jgi:transcriptional regulator, MarR family